MASTTQFVEYACAQASETGECTYRKMFGEFGLYFQGKFIGVVCGNQLFVKQTAAGRMLVPDIREEAPYEGASPYFVVDFLENRPQLQAFLLATYAELPEPKPKKRKGHTKKTQLEKN